MFTLVFEKKKERKIKQVKLLAYIQGFFLVIVLRNSVVIKHLGGEAVRRGIII